MNTSTDLNNCGACGTVCTGAGAVCTRIGCRNEVVLAAGRTKPGGIAVQGNSVYWLESANIMKVPVGGGTLTPLAPVNGGGPQLAIDATYAYWTEPSTGQKVLLAGGTPQAIPGGNQYGNFAIQNGTMLYWASYSIIMSGSTPLTTSNGGFYDGSNLSLDSSTNTVYFLGLSTKTSGYGWSIFSLPTNELIKITTGPPNGLLAANGSVYVNVSDGFGTYTIYDWHNSNLSSVLTKFSSACSAMTLDGVTMYCVGDKLYEFDVNGDQFQAQLTDDAVGGVAFDATHIYFTDLATGNVVQRTK